MSNKLKIISDGTAAGTRVYARNTELDGITEIEFEPIVPGGVVSAKLTFSNVELDIVAELRAVPDDERFLQQIVTVKPIDTKLAE